MTVARDKSPKATHPSSKMHQSSHRILRWVDDGARPHSKDLHDLFCILMVAVPLRMHRVRLQKRYSSFTTYDALHKLANLKFVHTNKRYSPEDPSVLLLTTLVTTYAMVPEMARLLCRNFLAARLLESCENKTDFDTPDSVWQPTAKGINLLQAFSARNGVTERHVSELVDSPRNNLRLLILERDRATDVVLQDRGTVEVIFRRLIGTDAPNVRPSHTGSDTDSFQDAQNTLAGVRLIREKRVGGRVWNNVFSGRACVDWLMSCCTFITEKEASLIAARFVGYGFCEMCLEEKSTLAKNGFSASKHAYYRLTTSGQEAVQWVPRSAEQSGGDSPKSTGTTRDSNRSRMLVILNAPALRLVFREFLRDTHCEENFIFFTEVDDFLYTWSKSLHKRDDEPTPELLRETLASSYDLYNAFLAPGSPCELNIDHNLRSALIKRMTKPELPEEELRGAVEETVQLYSDAKSSIFKLMASDSVPKFLRDSRYSEYLDQHGVNSDSSNHAIASEMSKLTI